MHVFNRLRQSRHWWLAPTASTLFGNVSDTLAFFFIAFWRSPDAFMAEHWMEIALVDYCFKVLISIVFLPANVWRITQYAVEKDWQINPKSTLCRRVKGSLSEL